MIRWRQEAKAEALQSLKDDALNAVVLLAAMAGTLVSVFSSF